MKKKLTLIIFTSFVLFLTGCTDNNWQGYEIEWNDDMVQIYYFWGDGCPACDVQNQFWERLENNEEYADKININKFEVWHNHQNANLMSEVWSQLWRSVEAVPVIFVWEEKYIWITQEEIKQKLDKCINEGCNDPVREIIENF